MPKSATIPLCHLAQEQDGYLSDEAMAHVAELVGITPAEVLGTASFYEMFKLQPVGRYLVNVCTNISCQLLGGEELLHHAEETLGIESGSTTPDGMFTLEDVECIAACTEAPACQVNYRYFHNVSHEDFDQLIGELRRRLGVTTSRPTARSARSARTCPVIGSPTSHRRRGQGKPVWIARHEQERNRKAPARERRHDHGIRRRPDRQLAWTSSTRTRSRATRSPAATRATRG